VNPLITLVRSLGNDRAVANVTAILNDRQREDWLVQGLTLRLDQPAGAALRPEGLRAAS